MINVTYQSNLKQSCSKILVLTKEGRSICVPLVPDTLTVLLSLCGPRPYPSLTRFDSFTDPEEVTNLLLGGVIFSCINELN